MIDRSRRASDADEVPVGFRGSSTDCSRRARLRRENARPHFPQRFRCFDKDGFIALLMAGIGGHRTKSPSKRRMTRPSARPIIA
ncbi:MAG: hypothetical protein ACLUEQ_13395 [Cloacibacillus evryensis]